MAQQFTYKKLFTILSSIGVVSFSDYASAAAFQLWEQDGASIGNYHAGRAASAEDASTAFYNPAGLVRIKNQQLVLGVDPIVTEFKFHGNVDVNTVGFGDAGPTSTASEGGGMNFVPNLHYAAPLCDRLVLGLSAFSPFGLKTDYSQEDYTRYAATLTSLRVIDISPSFGLAITDKLSVGGGIDFQRANAEFDLVAGNQLLDELVQQKMDTYGQNTGADHAYGFHAGILYEFTPQTRMGVSYMSRVIHKLRGSSLFYGPLANDDSGGTQNSEFLQTKITLPPTTTLSLFHSFNSRWDAMGSVSYTQWSVLQSLDLFNVAAVVNGASSNNVTVTIPEHYHNTWNFSVGSNYHVNEEWMLRTGLGFDQTPSNNADRNLQLPDNNRFALAVGAHFQATKSLGFDAGYTHIFVSNTRINNTINVGDQSTTVSGNVHANADVYGFQLKWDIV